MQVRQEHGQEEGYVFEVTQPYKEGRREGQGCRGRSKGITLGDEPIVSGLAVREQKHWIQLGCEYAAGRLAMTSLVSVSLSRQTATPRLTLAE